MAVSAIDLPPVADVTKHRKTVVPDGGSDSVIAGAVALRNLRLPVSAWPKRARVVPARDAFAQIAQHAPLAVRV